MIEEDADQNTCGFDRTGCGLLFNGGDGYGMPDYYFDGEGFSAAESDACLRDADFLNSHFFADGEGF